MPELIDPVEYINNVKLEPTCPLTATSSFSQFKQVFVGSPRVRDADESWVGDYEDPCKYERLQKMNKAKKTSYVSESSGAG